MGNTSLVNEFNIIFFLKHEEDETDDNMLNEDLDY